MKHFLVIVLILFIACTKKDKTYPELEMAPDEIVHALVQMYTANAAININDLKYRDSISDRYFEQVAKLTKKPIDVIKSDFEKLELMQDSLLVLQGRALDTLRILQERQLKQSLEQVAH